VEFEKLIPHLRKLGRGAFRTTYALSDEKVLKIDHMPGARSGCAGEVETWETLRNTQAAQYLAPIYDSGHGWLIMARAQTPTDFREQDDLANKVWNLVKDFGIDDVHGRNVGYYAGRMVVIDYGICDRLKLANVANVQVAKPKPASVPVVRKLECAYCGEAVCECHKHSFI